MFDPQLFLPFAHVKQEQFLREADEWRVARLLGDRSSDWNTFRRFAGNIIIRAGEYIGNVTLDDCLPRPRQTA